MGNLRRIAVCFFMAWLCAPAGARVISDTQISYYTIGGTSPEAIFRAILSRGPRVNGAKAIASIGTRSTQDAGLEESGGACRLTGYTIKLDFIITRPRIQNPGVLSARDRASWNEMNGFIAAHENQHKKTWLSCAADLDKRLSSMTAPSCAKLAGKGDAMWQQMLASCNKRQRAFDDIQARQLEALPFMKRARSGAN